MVLRLLAENNAEHEFNAEVAARLQRMYGCTVKNLEFSRAEICSTLDNAVAAGDLITAADISLISLDEWWIRDYALRRQGEPEFGMSSHPLMPLESQFETHTNLESDQRRFGSEHWVFEFEKATVERATTPGGRPVTERFGAPNCLDFGIFCVGAKYSGSDRAQDAIAAVPRVWTATENGAFSPIERQDETTVVGWLREKLVRCGPSVHGFVFDLQTVTTAVCVFLGFAWAGIRGHRDGQASWPRRVW